MIRAIKNLLLLSAVIGLSKSSPVEFKESDSLIEPRAVADPAFRLSDDIRPSSYEVTLTPYFEIETGKEAFTFDGKVIINLRATKASVRTVVLHANDLVINNYEFSGALTASGTFDNAQYDNKTDKWTITVNSDIQQSVTTVLTINYKGFLRDDMNGFYRSYYYENNQKVWMASTQFQQTEARRAFPCFDEPGFKATFKLRMIRPRDMTTLSNTKIVSQVNETLNGKERTTDEFAWTPRMSTYLLAFIVSKYDGLKNGNDTFGVYARPAAKEQLRTALEFGQEMLGKFGDYLGINYYTVENITKMDMAAIPDFSAGAMENWGLLTYRETSFLHYLTDTPSINEQRIVAVIAHEQAHMWFGDLLTCNWWSETWLNEGFARYFQFFGTKMVKTDWDLEEQFVIENHQQSMQLDSTDSTHPMTDVTVSTKSQASGMFDNISYNKAGSIIRMLSHYIGLTKFQETLKHYLDSNRLSAVVPDNLFTSIDAINQATFGFTKVSEFWAPWTETPGFPLVTARLNNLELKLSQKRFKRSGISHSHTEAYNIPITVAIDSDDYVNTSPLFIFRIVDGIEKSYNLTKKPAKYFILNKQQVGYYRVNYDEENWNNIRTALFTENHDNIHVLNRAQIVDDLFNLARAGIVKYDQAIDTIRYIKNEKNYIPWLSAISHGLTFLSQRVVKGNQETFSWFIQDLTEKIYDHLKFLPQFADRRTDIYNRVNILTWACKYGHDDCIKQSKSSFEAYKAGTPVDKNLRGIVYCNAIRHGNEADFNFLYDKFMTQDIGAEQLNYLIGMACTKNDALIKKYLDRITDTDHIRPQDRSAAVNNILNSNDEGPDYLYNHITTNVDKWRTTFGGLNTLTTVAQRFTTEEQFNKYSAFLEAQKNNLGDSYNSLNTALIEAKANLEWDGKYMKEFIDHLNKLKNSAPVKIISLFVTLVPLVVLFIFN